MSLNSWLLPIPNVKNINKHVIIDLIRFTPGGISRIELAKALGLTRAAISVIIADLMESGVIREIGKHSNGGRKPVALEINPDGGKVLGIDIGASHATFILADLAANVLQEAEIVLDISTGPQNTLDLVDQRVQRLLSESNLKLSDIKAIGVGVPGPVVLAEGMVDAPPIMPGGWDRFPIRDYMRKLWGVPVSINNDADLGVLGEWAYGAGRGQDNLVYIKVGSGVGAGFLLNGQLYQGSMGSAGEIGHITVDANGPLCSCGNRGCVEAAAGGKAIARQAIEAICHGERTRLSEIVPPEKITYHDVINAARRGDLLAQRLVTDAGNLLGTTIASLVNVMNPTMIIVGGGVSRIGDLLLEPIRKQVFTRSLKVAARSVTVMVSLLGRRSTGMGAVVQAISIVLHQLNEYT